MSEKDDSNQRIDDDRRDFLQGVGATGAATTLTSLGALGGLAGSAAAYTEENYEWRKQDRQLASYSPSGSSTEYELELTSSLAYLESYTDGNGDWVHHFNMGGTAQIMSKQTWEGSSAWSECEDVYRHKIGIYNRNASTSYILASTKDDRTGADPIPQDQDGGNNFGDAAFTAMKAAVSEVNKKFNYLMTAAEIVDALLGDADEDEGNDYKEFRWNYSARAPSNLPVKAANSCDFKIENDPGYSSAHFDVSNLAVGDKSTSTSISWTVSVDPMGNIESLNGGSVSTADAGLEPVPTDEIPDDEDIQQLADGGTLYRATDPKVTVRRNYDLDRQQTRSDD
ncbi:twin-arginine translocation signal domain-containing protein [Halorussus caseinilyticus]|uniref:Twin-arginine translocation signal domain-containing protein n=1 Tax=Halorussus caseinilyticus TaxID=3034025 RepID=A0ABD5WNX0_9EURY|nr:twin-arginine translocation signal domain-containing protein [Halorussus sp. DT72]